MPTNHTIKMIPPIHEWAFYHNKWLSNGMVLFQQNPRKKLLLESPQFELPAGVYYLIILEFEGMRYSNTEFILLESKINKVIKCKKQKGWGEVFCSIGFFATKHNEYKLRFYNSCSNGNNGIFRNLKVSLLSYHPFDVHLPPQDTTLEHWGFFKKSLHSLCKKSRHLNIVVSFIEMHMGKTEIVSLPSFVALCPTGQCNAKCLFCSVSENRSGIRKAAISKEALELLISQIGRSVWIFGIEGNGEPLLYKQFDQLIATIFSKNATAYLISNGSLLTDNLICLLASEKIDSINFSINAASAKTHSCIMGLDNLDEIKENIKKIVRCRGDLKKPDLSISFVVTRVNITEVIDFIVLAESLKIDRVFIRPLSEIASSEGTVEDVRSIVPFEIDILNLKEEIEDYIHDAKPKIEIVFDYNSFKAIKTNPLNAIPSVEGYEDRLIPPNRRYWHCDSNDVSIKWNLNTVAFAWKKETDSVIFCDPIPVKKQVQLKLKCHVSVKKGDIAISINGINGSSLIEKRYGCSETCQSLSQVITVQTGDNDWVDISIQGTIGSMAIIDFERVRSYPKPLNRDELLADSNKWEKGTHNLKHQFTEHGIKLSYEGKKYAYLLKSYGIPCLKDESIRLGATIDVHQGDLGIGILSENGLKWITASSYPKGLSKDTLRFSSGDNDRFHIVFYATSDEKLDAEVQWTGFEALHASSSAIAAHDKSEPIECNQGCGLDGNHAKIKMGKADGPKMGNDRTSDIPSIPIRKTATFGFKQFIRKHTKVYCQKPWTDLSNFTVDGRMDVCCIATGESQKDYALGYLAKNSFQEIWNGPVAQKFRMTVNRKGKRLPPCSRCPMAYQQQGLLFSLGFTKEYFKTLIRRVAHEKVPRLFTAIFKSKSGHVI